jgi:hypothetical protein
MRKMPPKSKINGRVIEETRELKHRTKKDAAIAALDESVRRRKQQEILLLFGTLDYAENYDYRRERGKRRGNATSTRD